MHAARVDGEPVGGRGEVAVESREVIALARLHYVHRGGERLVVVEPVAGRDGADAPLLLVGEDVGRTEPPGVRR